MRLFPRAGFLFQVLVLSLAATPRSIGATVDAAAVFAERCAPCHTIGGGDLSGPDLIGTSKQAATAVRESVVRMQDNTGPMSAEEIDALVAFVRGGGHAPAPAVVPEVPKGSATVGRRLFFGAQPLEKGGSPCFACHTVAGEGGNLAADLTLVHTRLDTRAITAAAENPPFPLMKAAYAAHPVTTQEARDLAAFLEQPATGPVTRNADGATVHRAAGGVAAGIVCVLAIAFRSRRAGTRSRMVRGSSRR